MIDNLSEKAASHCLSCAESACDEHQESLPWLSKIGALVRHLVRRR